MTSDGEVARVLTSPAKSPRFGNIGMAVLEAAFASDGRRLEVAVAEGVTVATVSGLPIYDPQKRRPRA